MDFQTRYEFNPKTDLLGKGGFSKVYRANDTLLDRTVALKFFTANASDKYQILNEIKKVIRFEHPNLCKYYDVAVLTTQNIVGETEKTEVGIMEYLDAGDFKTYLKSHPQYIDRLLIDVLKGLSYLHKKGIVHRDLKPQNILVKMVDDEPVAKITDFGISKKISSDDNNSSALMGTIEYMAPEQFNPKKYGIGGRITTNLDLWSFGLLVYEAIQHKPLFGSRSTGTSAEQVMRNILSDASLIKADSLPYKYRNIVKRCLEKDASKRVQNAYELIPLFSEEPPHEEKIIMEPDRGDDEHIDPDGETQVLQEELDEETKVFDPEQEMTTEATQVLPSKQEETGENTWVLQTGQDARNEETQVLPSQQDTYSDDTQVINRGAFAEDVPVIPKEQKGTARDTAVGEKKTTSKSTKKVLLFTIVPVLLIVGFIVIKSLNQGKATPPEKNNHTEKVPPPVEHALPELVAINEGKFTMGSKSREATKAELPAHTVRLDAFSIGKYEVTIDQFRQFVNESRYVTTAEKEGKSEVFVNGNWETRQHINWRHNVNGVLQDITVKNTPVVHISWMDADAYCKWLSQKGMGNFRLPTEAEWEYAAKGGNLSKGFTYSGSNNIEEVAWYASNSESSYKDVGKKKPNELDIHDMSGNVMEWCNDWYKEDYYRKSPASNPSGPGSGEFRVVRGGAWWSETEIGWLRTSFRVGLPPNERGGQLGFRICKTAN